MSANICFSCKASVALSTQFCPNCSEPAFLFGRYQTIALLGKGGAGTVYKVLDTKTQKPCAVKIVSSNSPIEQQQVMSEAKFLDKYSSQFTFIPMVYEVRGDTFRTYLVMEFIEGKTLEETLSKPWPSVQVEYFLRSLLEYLSKLHNVGIVHRDIKPGNIMRTPDGKFVLIDFGIAKEGLATRTVVRKMGTVYYTPLEQLHGQETDARTDIYSLGATAYHLLTGHPPIPADARKAGAMLKKASELVQNVPAVLNYSLSRMLEVDQASRPASANEVIELLNVKSVPPFASDSAKRVKNPPPELLTARTKSQNRTAITVAVVGVIGACLAAIIGLLGQAGSIPVNSGSSASDLATERAIHASMTDDANLTRQERPTAKVTERTNEPTSTFIPTQEPQDVPAEIIIGVLPQQPGEVVAVIEIYIDNQYVGKISNAWPAFTPTLGENSISVTDFVEGVYDYRLDLSALTIDAFGQALSGTFEGYGQVRVEDGGMFGIMWQPPSSPNLIRVR